MKKEYKKIVYTAVIVLSFLILETICLLLIKNHTLQKELTMLKNEYNSLQQSRKIIKESESESITLAEEAPETETEDMGVAESEEPQTTMEVFHSIEVIEVGKVLDEAMINLDNLESYFKTSEISENIYSRINGKSYRENENISIEDLRYLKVLHYNFDHEIQVGELIVNSRLAEDVINIFKELFEGEYEINSMYLVDNYWDGDARSTDTVSIQENNSSGFNYREIEGGEILSKHAYGCAIDINPQQNPYITYNDGQPSWKPENATAYIDRTSGEKHMINHDDLCYQTFIKYGFEWGGDWTDIQDYQHFQKDL